MSQIPNLGQNHIKYLSVPSLGDPENKDEASDRLTQLSCPELNCEEAHQPEPRRPSRAGLLDGPARSGSGYFGVILLLNQMLPCSPDSSVLFAIPSFRVSIVTEISQQAFLGQPPREQTQNEIQGVCHRSLGNRWQRQKGLTRATPSSCSATWAAVRSHTLCMQRTGWLWLKSDLKMEQRAPRSNCPKRSLSAQCGEDPGEPGVSFPGLNVPRSATDIKREFSVLHTDIKKRIYFCAPHRHKKRIF